MIIDNKRSGIETFGDVQNFKIGIDPKNIDFITTLLSSNLYSNPEKSFIREIVSNAWDSHVEAGNTDTPVLIIIEDGNITIRDYGTGMSPERFNDIYCNIGSSTKRESNDYIGAFGIGHYAPLACSNTVYVTSFYNGTEYQYIMTKVGNSITTSLVLQRDTEEKNGVQVTVKNILNYSNSFIYRSALDSIVFFPNVYIKAGTGLNINNYAKIKHYKNFAAINRTNVDKILLGNVLYPLDSKNIQERDVLTFLSKINYIGITLKFDIGSLEVTPNREQIIYTDNTKKTIIEKARQARDEINSIIEKLIVKDYTDFIDFIKAFDTVQYDFLEEKFVDDLDYRPSVYNYNIEYSNPLITYKGKKVDTAIVARITSVLTVGFRDVRGVINNNCIYTKLPVKLLYMVRYNYDKILLIDSTTKLSANKKKFLITYYADYVILNKFSKKEVLEVLEKNIAFDLDKEKIEFIADNLYESLSRKIITIDFNNDSRYNEIVEKNSVKKEKTKDYKKINLYSYDSGGKHSFSTYKEAESYLKSHKTGIVILPYKSDKGYKESIYTLCKFKNYKVFLAPADVVTELHNSGVSCIVPVEKLFRDKEFVKIRTIHETENMSRFFTSGIQRTLAREDFILYMEVTYLMNKSASYWRSDFKMCPIDPEYLTKLKNLISTIERIQTIPEELLSPYGAVFSKNLRTAFLLYTKTYRVSYEDYKQMKQDKILKVLCKKVL